MSENMSSFWSEILSFETFIFANPMEALNSYVYKNRMCIYLCLKIVTPTHICSLRVPPLHLNTKTIAIMICGPINSIFPHGPLVRGIWSLVNRLICQIPSNELIRAKHIPCGGFDLSALLGWQWWVWAPFPYYLCTVQEVYSCKYGRSLMWLLFKQFI